MTTGYTIEDLRFLMKRLRDPETGCPWDLKQSYQTIAPILWKKSMKLSTASNAMTWGIWAKSWVICFSR